MSYAYEDLLQKKRDKVIAIILGVKDRECDRYLPDAVQQRFRKVILDQINDLADMANDIIKSLESNDVTFNELYLDKINEIHQILLKNGGDS